MEIILQPFSEPSLGEVLQAALQSKIEMYRSFHAAVAFAKRSGVQYIEDELQSFVERGGQVRMVIGIDQLGTSQEALSDLMEAIGDGGEIWITHDENRYVTFHPKLYLFEAETSALLIVGSGNLTEGGLYTNDEALSVQSLDLDNVDDKAVFDEVKATFDMWCNEEFVTVNRLDEAFLQLLVEADYVRSESQEEWEANEKATDKQTKAGPDEFRSDRTSLFGKGPGRHRPARRKRVSRRREKVVVEPAVVEKREPRGFVMTLICVNQTPNSKRVWGYYS